MSSRRLSPIAVFLAIVLPAIIFAVSWDWFERPTGPTGKAEAMERSLKRAGRVDVVVLGSSLARTNVRTDLLADELGVPRRNVVLLTLPNATAAHWYAIMKNRVFGNGHRPKAVVLVGALTTMVTPDVLMDSNVERLVNQLSDNEPVIARKVLHTENARAFRWLYMREQAGAIRDAIVETYRDLSLSLAFKGKGNLDVGAKLASKANEVVFADENMDYELHNRMGTGLWVGAVEEIDLEGLDIARDSLVPDIAQLAQRFGSKAVFVRTPFPPSNNDNDYVPDEYEAEAVEVMGQYGGVYIDLRALNLDDTYFRDMRHMSREGATIFTKAMADTMRDVGAMRRKGATATTLGLTPGDVLRTPAEEALTAVEGHATRLSGCAWRLDLPVLAPIQAAALARAGRPTTSPLRVTVDGEPIPWRDDLDPDVCERAAFHGDDGIVVTTEPDVEPSSLGLSLVQEVSFRAADEPFDAWWVYPGTTLRFVFDEAWPHEPDTFDAFALGHRFGGNLADVSVKVAGQPLKVDGAGSRFWAEGSLMLPDDGGWYVEVSSPENGPWLLLQNLRVGKAPFSAHLVGLPEFLAGASIRIVGGKVEDTEVAPVFASDPPSLGVDPGVRKAKPGVAMFSLPRFEALADAPNSRSTLPHKCTPIQVLEDGVALPEPHVTCLDMTNLKAGRSCHAGNMLYFTATDSTDPTSNGRDYSVALDPSRVCDRRNQHETTPLRGSLWLYPGDTLQLPFPDDKLDMFYDGANRLEIALDPLLYEKGESVRVRLLKGDEVLLDERVTASGKRREYRRRYFEPPLPARAKDIRLEIVNESEDAYWLLVMAALSEHYEYGVGQEEEDEASEDTDGAEDTDAEAEVEIAPEPEPEAFGEEGVDPFAADEPAVAPAGDLPPSKVERFGPVPELPEPKDLRTVKGDLVEAHLFTMWPQSNSVMEKRGYGWWSPLRVSRDGTALRAAASRTEFRDGDCGDCFMHLGQSVVVRSPDGPKPELRASLEAGPVTVEGGDQEVYWVYPGGGLRFVFDKPWQGEGAKVKVHLDTFTSEKNTSWAPPRLRGGGKEVEFEPAERGWVATLELSGRGTAPWGVDVRIGPNGPYLLLLDIMVEDAKGAWQVLTAPPVP